MNKRISARAIIFDNDYFYALFRRKKVDNIIKEYYSLPGGGKEDKESIDECIIRELKEEFSVDIKIINYLDKDEGEDFIAHLYHCEIISGTPILGGEELERNNIDNYYEIRKLSMQDLDKADIKYKDLIKELYAKKEI